MAYTALATKTDGDTLTASHLNAVAGNIEFLYGLVQAPNIGFVSVRATLTSESPRIWTFIHLHRYLHYHIIFTGSTGGDLDIATSTDGDTYTGRFSDGAPSGTIAGYLDTSTYGLTVGDPYYVEVSWDIGAATDMSVLYLIESDSTSL